MLYTGKFIYSKTCHFDETKAPHLKGFGVKYPVAERQNAALGSLLKTIREGQPGCQPKIY